MEHIWLLILAAIGFSISGYIWYTKSRKLKMVCLRGEDCDRVVSSEYGKLLGIDITIPGMLYYGLVFTASLLEVFIPGFFALTLVVWGKLIISGGAALFSVYLTFVQFAILKEWCEYCLTSAALSIAIFIVVLL